MTRHLATLSFSPQRPRYPSGGAQASFALWGLFWPACFLIAWVGTSLKRTLEGAAPTPFRALRRTLAIRPRGPLSLHGITPIRRAPLVVTRRRTRRGLPRSRLCCRWSPTVPKKDRPDRLAGLETLVLCSAPPLSPPLKVESHSYSRRLPALG